MTERLWHLYGSDFRIVRKGIITCKVFIHLLFPLTFYMTKLKTILRERLSKSAKSWERVIFQMYNKSILKISWSVNQEPFPPLIWHFPRKLWLQPLKNVFLFLFVLCSLVFLTSSWTSETGLWQIVNLFFLTILLFCFCLFCQLLD